METREYKMTISFKTQERPLVTIPLSSFFISNKLLAIGKCHLEIIPWLLGLQFEALFTDGTYFEICKRANLLAEKITAACREAGFPEYAPSPTNQRFFIFPDDVLKRLEENYVFSFWEKRTKSIPPCGSAPAGPPGRKTWTS